jgi:MurNAc alpha-1-phosphate uridylyltransferase
MSVRAMILAAGRGERMRPLTDRVPKPLLEVNGEALIERHLRALARAHVTEVVINLAWLGDQIRARLGDGAAYGVSIRYSPEPPGALETGGGIRRALSMLGDRPFLVVNGDVWADVDYAQVTSDLALGEDDLAGLLLVPTPAYKAHHDFALAGRRVVPAAPTHTFSGIGLYRAGLFDHAPAEARFPLAPLLRTAIVAQRVAGAVHDGLWHDVGTPQRLAALSAQDAQGELD